MDGWSGTGADAAPGWYPDPWVSGQHRWWDGARWTADVFTATVGAAPAPAPGAPGAPPSAPAAVPPPAPAWGSLPPVVPPPTWAPPSEVISAGEGPRSNRGLVITALVVAGCLALGGIAWLLLRDTGRSTPAAAATRTAPAPAPSPTNPGSPSPAPTSPAPAPSPSGPHAGLLQNLVVRQQDVPETAVVAPIAGGTEVQGQVTLDLCSGTFASESLRLERLQTAVFQASGEATFSTEAVLYRSPAATDQAFRELRSVSASCPTTPVTNASGETVTYRFQEAPDTAWPRTKGVDRQAYRFTVTQSDGTVRTLDAVYLKRGPVLLGLYFLDPDGAQTPVEGRTTVPGIVALFEQRLLRDGSGSGVDSGTGTTA